MASGLDGSAGEEKGRDYSIEKGNRRIFLEAILGSGGV